MRPLLLAVTALAPLLASAEAPGANASAAHGVYVFAKAGAILAQHEDLDLRGFDAGPAVEAGAGMKLLPFLALEVGAGYLAFSDRQSGSVRLGSGPAEPVVRVEAERTLRTVPLFASLRLSGRWRFLELFGLAGAGLCFTSYDVASRVGPGESSPGGSWSASDTDTSPGLHVGAGIAALVTPHVALGVEARYLWAESTFWLEPPQSSTVRPGNLEVTTRLDSVALAATLAYRF